MTKSEAEIVRAALKYWRAAKGFNRESPDVLAVIGETVEKARTGLLEAIDRAAPSIKDWVSVIQSADANEGFIACAGCKHSERVQGPFTMEFFAAAYQEFRVAHIDCGPVEDPV